MNEKEFLERLKTENPHNISPLDTYKGSREKIQMQCNVCNYVWSAFPSNLLYKKTGCPRCAGQVISNDDYISRLRRVNDSIMPIEPYINNSTKTAVQCTKCKHIWSPRPADLFMGKGCPNCANIKKGVDKRKTDEEFKTEIAIKNPYIDVLECYVNDKTKILVKCRDCGNEWRATPNNLLKGKRCPKCARVDAVAKRTYSGATNRKKTNEEFIRQIQDINPLIEIKETYNGDAVPLIVQCKQCNYSWRATPSMLLRGSGCPRCARSQSSFMEQYIYWAFVYALGEDKVLYRNRTLIGNELDICIPEKNLAIEPGGYYYHKENLDLDIAKIEKCKQIGIRLIIFYDNCKDVPLSHEKKDVYYFKHDLKYEPNNKTLRDIISKLFDEYSISCNTSEKFWHRVFVKANEHSKRKSKEQLQSQLMSNGFLSITIMGEYEGNHKAIAVKCNTCGNEWSATPHNLLAGRGCPKCGAKRRADLRSKKVRCIETGEVFSSIAAANRQFHTTHISDVCNNKRELAGGYHWEYFQD